MPAERPARARSLATRRARTKNHCSLPHRHYREALALAEELGMRPLVARCHAGLANFYRRTGRHQQARELLTTPMTMYREMGMRFWLEEAEAEVKALE
jgi:hypothetical protein